MKLIVKQAGAGLGIALLLAGCGSFDGRRDSMPVASPAPLPATSVRDGTPKLGAPYTIGDTSFTPADIADYDAVGYASWYGDEFAGKPTANGEIYNPTGISAAHKTLPMPSYVEVTALDTGRTILLRVNDRGPMVKDRLIDLSAGAAKQLGLTGGTAAVRVRRTNPPESERAQLRAGRAVNERLPTPDSLLAILRKNIADMPKPAARVATSIASTPVTPSIPASSTPASPPTPATSIVEGKKAATAAAPAPKKLQVPSADSSGQYLVQVAAFSSKSSADATATAVGGRVSAGGKLWRVRMGPYASESEAKAAQKTARSKGFGDARVMRDR
jgi:rare lipoprotein A